MPITERYIKTSFGKSYVLCLEKMSSRFLLKKPYNAQKKVISNLDIEIVPDASHLLPVGKPDYVNQRVSDFINR